MLLAAVVGLHCASPTDEGELVTESSEAEVTLRPVREPKKDDPPVEDRSSEVTSTAPGADGSRYVAGVFKNKVVKGHFMLSSKGGDDVFLAHVLSDGTVAWARSIGSRGAESGPRVTFADGEVKVLAVTDGAVNCGRGSLARWSTEFFFFCTFDSEGKPLNGATFPTGRP